MSTWGVVVTQCVGNNVTICNCRLASHACTVGTMHRRDHAPILPAGALTPPLLDARPITPLLPVAADPGREVRLLPCSLQMGATRDDWGWIRGAFVVHFAQSRSRRSPTVDCLVHGDVLETTKKKGRSTRQPRPGDSPVAGAGRRPFFIPVTIQYVAQAPLSCS